MNQLTSRKLRSRYIRRALLRRNKIFSSELSADEQSDLFDYLFTGRSKVKNWAITTSIAILPFLVAFLLLMIPLDVRFIVRAYTEVATLEVPNLDTAATSGVGDGLEWAIENPQVIDIGGIESPTELVGTFYVAFTPGTRIRLVSSDKNSLRLEVVTALGSPDSAYKIFNDEFNAAFGKDHIIQIKVPANGISFPILGSVKLGQELRPSLTRSPMLIEGNIEVELAEVWPLYSSRLMTIETRPLKLGDTVSIEDKSASLPASGFFFITLKDGILASYFVKSRELSISRYGVNANTIEYSVLSFVLSHPALTASITFYAALNSLLLLSIMKIVRRPQQKN